MPKFRKKPVVIEATCFTGPISYDEMCVEWGDEFYKCAALINDGELSIRTLEGTMKASLDDYVIKGINGEFYPCKPDIFEKTYELVP